MLKPDTKLRKKGRDPFIIRSARQIAALKAASRQEVLDTLAAIGTVSISELALALGRAADSLYYHVRILEKVGLVEAAGTRGSVQGTESLYRAVSPDLRIAYVPGKQGNAEGVSSVVESMLRLTSRDFREAFLKEDTVVDGPKRELWATRTTGRLSPKDLAEINLHIASLLRTTTASASGRGERLYGLTVVLTPLHRSRE